MKLKTFYFKWKGKTANINALHRRIAIILSPSSFVLQITSCHLRQVGERMSHSDNETNSLLGLRACQGCSNSWVLIFRSVALSPWGQCIFLEFLAPNKCCSESLTETQLFWLRLQILENYGVKDAQLCNLFT